MIDFRIIIKAKNVEESFDEIAKMIKKDPAQFRLETINEQVKSDINTQKELVINHLNELLFKMHAILKRSHDERMVKICKSIFQHLLLKKFETGISIDDAHAFKQRHDAIIDELETKYEIYTANRNIKYLQILQNLRNQIEAHLNKQVIKINSLKASLSRDPLNAIENLQETKHQPVKNEKSLINQIRIIKNRILDAERVRTEIQALVDDAESGKLLLTTSMMQHIQVVASKVISNAVSTISKIFKLTNKSDINNESDFAKRSLSSSKKKKEISN